MPPNPHIRHRHRYTHPPRPPNNVQQPERRRTKRRAQCNTNNTEVTRTTCERVQRDGHVIATKKKQTNKNQHKATTKSAVGYLAEKVSVRFVVVGPLLRGARVRASGEQHIRQCSGSARGHARKRGCRGGRIGCKARQTCRRGGGGGGGGGGVRVR
jgi:hypothetical protein